MRDADDILRLLSSLRDDLPARPAGGIGLDDGFDLVDQIIETVTDLLGGSSITNTREC